MADRVSARLGFDSRGSCTLCLERQTKSVCDDVVWISVCECSCAGDEDMRGEWRDETRNSVYRKRPVLP